MFTLPKQAHTVMVGLFKGWAGKRGTLKWRDFVAAMNKVGFECMPKSSRGPGTIFRSVADQGMPTFSWIKPHGRHGGELAARDQARLAKMLQERYGWSRASFRLRQ
ncbi:hypothetical protein OH77DRAFT_1523595 [Trametes cingulata]|nr:hypothetical protein OH77DRAFT_1523595 [Trametes cingulata]